MRQEIPHNTHVTEDPEKESAPVACRLSLVANSGQTMILTVLALGGTILGATTIAGLLLVSQIRQSNSASDSFRAIFAADTGIEWGLYQFFKPDEPHQEPVMTTGPSFTVSCVPDGDCRSDATTDIHAIGISGRSARAFDLSL